MKIKKPNLSPKSAPEEDIEGYIREAMTDDADIINHHFINLELIEQDLEKLCFQNTIFENCRFISCTLSQASFLDCLFKNCDFSNSNMENTYFNRCEAKHSKFMGSRLQNSRFQHFSLSTCNFKYANFDSGSFSCFHLANCEMSEAFFSSCKFVNVSVDESRFIRTSFYKTALKNLDFSNSQMESIELSEGRRELEGIIVDTYQAAELAKYMGVIIKNN